MVRNRCRAIPARTVIVGVLVTLMLAAAPAAFAVAPSNDNFEDAIPVPGLPFIDSQDTSQATTEPGDQECAGIGYTVWYSVTTGTDIELEASTFGSDYDTTVSVYTQGPGGLSQLACNDDAAGTLQSRVRFDATAFETYYIQVGTFYGTPGGNLNFLVQEAPPLSPPPVLAISINPQGSVNRNGVATVRGTVTCSEPVFASIEVFLRQTVSRPIAEGFGWAGVECDGPTLWEATVYPYTGSFSSGAAIASAATFACDSDEQCGDASTSRSVILRTGSR